MPRVSVVIPTYNRGHYLRETLDSVFYQTYRDIEIIVVDDGSTENTPEFIKEYLDRIIYIYKENGGQGSARNVGINRAKGEYIAFLDSDDLWLPQKIKIQVEYMDKHPEYGMIFSKCEFIDEMNKVIGEWECPDDTSFDSLLMRGNTIMVPTVMVRREVFDVAGLFDERRELIGVEDYDMWLRIGFQYKIGFLDAILARYRFHGGNISFSKKEMQRKSLMVLDSFASSDLLADGAIRIRVLRTLAMWLFERGCMTSDKASMLRAREIFRSIIEKRPYFLRGYIYLLMSFLNLRFVKFVKKCEYRIRGRNPIFDYEDNVYPA